jgi:hypothetical protein
MTLNVYNNNYSNKNNLIQFYSCADSSAPRPITERSQTYKRKQGQLHIVCLNK